jgi:hypothetical protein
LPIGIADEIANLQCVNRQSIANPLIVNRIANRQSSIGSPRIGNLQSAIGSRLAAWHN